MNVGRSPRAARNAFTISLSGLLVLSLSGLQSKTEASNSDFTSLTGHVPAQVSSSRIIDRVQPDQTIALALALPISRQAALTDYLQHLYTPGDPIFGQYMTPETFAERFGPTQADYDAVAAYAEANGLHVTGRHPNRLVIDVEGRSADVETAFHTRLMHYQNAVGQIFRAPESEPIVPKNIAPRLNAVVGLSDEAVRRPHFRELTANQPRAMGVQPQQTGSGPGGGLTPSDIKTAYNLSSTSLNGTGQVLALFELDGYAAGDITAYEQAYGLPNVTLQNVLIDGYNGALGSGAVEVTLDIELMLALAPGASKIMVYEGPNSDQGVIDTYNKIAVDNVAKQISTSWGLDENSNPASVRNAENAIFQQMAAQGQTIYAASGDSGAYDNGSTLSVDDPASQPYMTGVGGTTLRTAGGGGAYSSETTWNGGSISGGGGGGGISTVWSIPSYQNGVVSTSSKGSKTARNVPDVSLDADPGTGYSIYFSGGWRIYGGTSCAAPLWAAFTALANQQRNSNGTPPLGFINPLLYNIGNGSRYLSDFHDIADSSTNLFYPAVTGYDEATGWGSFNGANLLINLIAGDATSGGPSGTIPTGLTATAGIAQVTLAWNTVSGAATYNVYRATTANGEGSTPVKSGLTSAAYTDTGLTNGTTYFYKVSAVNTAGESAKSSEASATPSAAAGPQSSAVFVKTDAATQGSWKGVYGADGYRLAGDTTSLPSYASLNASGQSSWTWAGSTSDTRALQKGGTATDQIASCDYASSSFRYDLNLTDGQAHQVAFYCLDWDTLGRSQTIQIFDAATNTLLDSQSAASFAGGKYLVWNITGHVTVQVTNTGSPNAVISGLFFTAAGAPQPPATPANLKAVAGNQSVTLTWDAASGASTYNVYRATTAGGEGSTPVKTGLTTAVYTDTGLTNGTTYFYKVSAVNTAGESVKSSEASTTPSAATGPQSSAVFVKTDAATQGSWKGVYGADGYRVLGDTTSLPAYATLSVSGQSNWTWAGSTSDTRAVQKASSATDRIASCDYSGSSFRYDLNLTDGQSHQVAFYCLDWETNIRSQTIQIFDAATNTLLDSQSVGSFGGGQYLVWNISGHVTVQVTNTGSSNAVISGVFFAAAGGLQIPAAPTGLTATAGNARVTLAWNTVSEAATYNVYRATTAGGEGSTPVKTGLTTAVYTDTGLTNGTTYFYKVSAVNTAGESVKSSEASTTPSAATGPQSSAVFVKTDAATQGSWKGVYGADGYRVLGDTTSLPAYATLSVSGQSNWTWAGSTSDVRALQKASSSTDRIASCDYASSSFRYDLNLTDGQSHQVAFYCLDWETNTRSQTIQIFDAATNTLLDSQSASSFAGGKYLVWNITGHVTVQVTNTGSPNAVIGGVFFR